MKAHTKEEFELFLAQLKETNQTLDFFCDFEKIYANVTDVEISLNILNYLLGWTDISEPVREIWQRDRGAFEVLPILIAVRDNGQKLVVDSRGCVVLLRSYFYSPEKVVEFLNMTGLAELFRNMRIRNLVDYVFGIETGLDTNARKNRSGHVMEGTIAKLFHNNDITFRQEVYSSEYPALNILGADEKRFDFVVETSSKVYLMEVNFYSGGGSKLNEVARSYTELAPKINSVGGFEFIWITDGIGWKSAKSKLEEAFYTIPGIYNLTTIDELIAKIKSE